MFKKKGVFTHTLDSSISSENAKYFVDLHFRLVELFTEANVTASNSKPECGNLISNLPRGLVLD